MSSDAAIAASSITGLPYLPLALAQVPRLLSHGDREPASRTWGCFDRTFWAWKFTDFAGSRYQEAAFALAYLYRSPEAGALHANPRILESCRAAMAYWRRLAHRDGSFDEAYPFERSLAATAFTAFYVGEAYRLIGGDLPGDDRQGTLDTLARAGDWLCRNDERHGVLSNHLAAAAAALTVVGTLTGEQRYAGRAEHFLARILDRQSSEGWYEEYGGADPGYQTHATFYLARIWQITGNATLLASLRRANAFLKHCVHPNGTLGGEYGARNTEFYFPAGFEILAAACPDARGIARFMRASVARGSAAGLTMMDQQNFLPLLNNYLFAHDAASQAVTETGSPPLPCESEGEWHFPDAGLHVRTTRTYYAVIGLSKGGVLKLYDRDSRQLVASDCGYWTRLQDAKAASSQSLSRPGAWTMTASQADIQARFVRINQPLMSPWLFQAFRAFCLTIGRFRWVAYRLKDALVHVLVRRRRALSLHLHRRITLTPDSVTIEDTLANPEGLQIQSVALGDKFATIHMGSARYFQPQEFAPQLPELLPGAAAELSAARTVVRSRTWRFPQSQPP